MAQSLVISDPDILGGTPVFAGTRVPVKNLFDYLETGKTIESFLRSFPTVTREQVTRALELSERVLVHPDETLNEIAA